MKNLQILLHVSIIGAMIMLMLIAVMSIVGFFLQGITI